MTYDNKYCAGKYEICYMDIIIFYSDVIDFCRCKSEKIVVLKINVIFRHLCIETYET
jgi:hypothetical protein